MGARHLFPAGPAPDDGSPPAADALLELVAEDADAGGCLRRASRHVVLTDREPAALRRMLASRGHRHTHEEVERAVYEVALELLPESWAAARERLRLRVEDARKTVPIGGARSSAGASEPARPEKGGPPVLVRRGKPDAHGPEADPDAGTPEGASPEGDILRLLSEDTACLREVASLSQYPLVGDELLRVSRRLWRAGRARGRHHRGRHFSDHVAAVVRDLFPHSPGAAWSEEWADAIARAGAEYVARRTPVGASPVPSEDEEKAFAEIREAAEREDRRAYRLAVRAWVDAVLAPFGEESA